MKSNERLQQDVEDAIKWEPSLHAAEIGVTVKEGIVTLSGTVDNYFKKMEAENAAKRVSGVKAVVEKIDVHLPNSSVKSDEEIAANIVKALENNWSVPDNKVKVKVENGWVYLEGRIAWDYQREAAKRAVEDIPGVKGVINNIKIKSDVHDQMEEKLIKDAFKRHWSLNDVDISIDVSGTTVTLTGSVSSIYEKEEAGRVAWKTPGIWEVVNKLVVEYDHTLAK